MKTGRYSLAELLDNDNIEHIIIPEMQRDYVWGTKNVERLLESIESNFRKKETMNLEIRCGKEDIKSDWKKHLDKEFERLRYNTRIGFIYAYYDRSDNRNLYLIDGQQRVTTLFLLLLAIYSQLLFKSEFEERYFKQERPKLDYKVRESAHSFLVNFIHYILSNPDGDFKAESEYYYRLYDTDPTIKAILTNYSEVRDWVKQHHDKESLLDYIENFIEFNYFDTGLSQQGERLYLYMNSRGEHLSMQEQIRPTIISHCPKNQKLKAGQNWERWQNFFWKYRDKNPNADVGFMGFLKVAVILHQAFYQKDGIRLKDFLEKNGKRQTLNEVREDYIRHNVGEQQDWIYRYILENSADSTSGIARFDYEWLSKVFSAYERVTNISCKYPFIREESWRSAESIGAVNYIPLCGVMLMVIHTPDIDDDNLYRLGMYLLCRSDDENNSKVADTATIRAMNFVTELAENGVKDIRELSKVDGQKENLMQDFGSIIWQHIRNPEWESLFWELISDREFNRFFNGRHDGFIRLACIDDNYELTTIRTFLTNFKDRFFKKREDKRLRKDLLNYGDITLNDRYNWKYEKSVRRLPAKNDLITLIEDKRVLIHNYVNKHDKPSPDNNLIALSRGLDYMSIDYLNYMWEEGNVYPNIILCERYQVKENLIRPLPVHLLHKRIKNSHLWGENCNFCVLEFGIDDSHFRSYNDRFDKYALDFVYSWDTDTPKWDIFLKRRGEREFESSHIQTLNDIAYPVDEDRTKLKFKRTFIDTKGYDAEGNLVSIEEIVNWLETIKPRLIDALDDSLSTNE